MLGGVCAVLICVIALCQYEMRPILSEKVSAGHCAIISSTFCTSLLTPLIRQALNGNSYETYLTLLKILNGERDQAGDAVKHTCNLSWYSSSCCSCGRSCELHSELSWVLFNGWKRQPGLHTTGQDRPRYWRRIQWRRYLWERRSWQSQRWWLALSSLQSKVKQHRSRDRLTWLWKWSWWQWMNKNAKAESSARLEGENL